MGCVSSKGGVSVTPALYHSGVFRDNLGSGRVRGEELEKKEKDKKKSELGELGRVDSACGSESSSVSFRLGNLQKYVEGEHVAAGWPAWLSAVAGEAIHGWLPLKADTFEKLEKIGQGTYSSVFRARDNETGKIVALKKVRFDNFEPESVRFMAREIMILRRLDHPNVMKLEGIVTSKLSCSIYLVFEYMEHDLSGLISCPDIKFTESQVKCYMNQLLSGLEHCHSRGIMHRDIKGSNLLVNNEGILKVADFGLANFCSTSHKQPLTSRVVTLWYRPPELLLGSTDYGPSIDLWSIGCVFAEVLLGKPLLQGRTEVEQLHKIFKLCGSPPDDYWKKSKLPHATLFKPQQRYENSLQDTCKNLPRTAVDLIQTLLSVEPYKRGNASSALSSEYFTAKPCACDPSTLPKYPPNKEIDAKGREEARRKKVGGRVRELEASRKTTKKLNGVQKPAPSLELPLPSESQNSQRVKVNGNLPLFQPDEDIRARDPPKPSIDQREEVSHSRNASQGDVPYSGPLQVPGSSGFAWAKNRRNDAFVRSHRRSGSKLSFNGLENYLASFDRSNSDLKKHKNGDIPHGDAYSRRQEYYETLKQTVRKQWSQFDHTDSFDAASDEYHSQELSLALYQKELDMKRNHHMDEDEKVEFSGPLLSQAHRVDELLERHERRIRQAVRRSLFQRGKKEGK